MKIGFVGLSHLGIVSAIGAAEMGEEIIAFDHDDSLISKLSSGRFSIQEPLIHTIYKRNRSRLTFTSQLQDISNCDLVFISLDVKTNDRDESDLGEVENLIEEVDSFISKDSCLVILSQVTPGFCRRIRRKIHTSLVYQVETLVFGNAVERYVSPERIIVGLSDTAIPLNTNHHKFLRKFACPILVMSYESAELTKISINIFLAATITATNSMSEISERIGADWNDIRSALILDRRIGPYAYITPGLGISGGNIERDLRTTKLLALKHGANSDLVDSIESNSKSQKLWPSRLILSKLDTKSAKACLAIWGITYKAGTHSLKNSPAIQNMKELSEHFTFKVFDPNVSDYSFVGLNVTAFTSPTDTLNGVEALLIFNESIEFTRVTAEDISQRMSRSLIIDPLGVRKDFRNAEFEYYTLGSSEIRSFDE